jgi:hypothetical protein
MPENSSSTTWTSPEWLIWVCDWAQTQLKRQGVHIMLLSHVDGVARAYDGG